MSGALGTGLYFCHPACLEHDPRLHLPTHPDTPERLLEIERRLEACGWLGWERREATAASERELELVHTARHVRELRELCEAGGGEIDADTFVGETSYRAALHAAGGACAMTRALLAGEASVGFCGVRPSGHHAERERAMGFCLFDNVAVAAELAIQELGVRRVFILDWDVHHGNGTAEIFRRRRDVLFVSIHQSGLFPGTGALEDVGSGEGEGYTLNLPVPAGSEGELWCSLLEHAGTAGGGCVRAAAGAALGGLRRPPGGPPGGVPPADGLLRGHGLPRARASGSPRGAAGGRAGGRLRTARGGGVRAGDAGGAGG